MTTNISTAIRDQLRAIDAAVTDHHNQIERLHQTAVGLRVALDIAEKNEAQAASELRKIDSLNAAANSGSALSTFSRTERELGRASGEASRKELFPATRAIGAPQGKVE